MRYEAERSRDNLQQEVARLDSQQHISNARLQEAHSEIRKCTGNNAILQNRICEFEKLTETMREKEFNMSQLVFQQNDDGSERLRVRIVMVMLAEGLLAMRDLCLNLLQEKCKSLQLQVHRMEQEILDAHQQIQVLQRELPDSMKQLQMPDKPDSSEAPEVHAIACLDRFVFNTHIFP